MINLDFSVQISGVATILIIQPGASAKVVSEKTVSVSAGRNLVSFSLTDYSGKSLPRGVYQYKLIYKGRGESGSVYVP